MPHEAAIRRSCEANSTASARLARSI